MLTHAFDQAHYRTVMGHLPTGVVALSGIDSSTAHPCGMVVGTFQSLSLDPPLVSFSIAHTSTSWPKIRTAGRLCANVLAVGQESVCRTLSSRQPDKFAQIEWSSSASSTPRISGAHAWIDCEINGQFDGGDHTIVIARILEMEIGEGEPLVFYKGRLGGYAELVPA